MRVATFNLFSGRSLRDGLVVPERLTAAVGELDADVLCLQEVDRCQERSGGTDFTAAVAAAAGAVDFRFVPALTGTPGAVWQPVADPEATLAPGAAAYGIGLVSRLPVLSWHLTVLPAAPVRSPVLVPGPGGRPRPLMLQDEPRVGVAAVVEHAGAPLTVATTHLSFVPGWNLVQLRRLVQALRPLPRPIVLLGDLNLPGGTPALALRGWRNLAGGLKTYPAPAPRVQFDHAYGQGPVHVRRAFAAELQLSDHRALVLDL